jgi:hypothetical protein
MKSKHTDPHLSSRQARSKRPFGNKFRARFMSYLKSFLLKNIKLDVYNICCTHVCIYINKLYIKMKHMMREREQTQDIIEDLSCRYYQIHVFLYVL